MKIQYALIIGILLFNCPVEAAMQEENNTATQKPAIDAAFLHNLDKVAAASGDKLSMAGVANTCLQEGDYVCAYTNILVSLTSRYWWLDLELPSHVFAIHDRARDGLSDKEAEEISTKVTTFFVELARKTGPNLEDEMANKTPKEWESFARQGKVLAAGHLAKKALEEKDYISTYKWATLASMGAVWQVRGENMLSYRDQARKHMTQKQMEKTDDEIRLILRKIKYKGMSFWQIRAYEKRLQELERKGIITKVRQ